MTKEDANVKGRNRRDLSLVPPIKNIQKINIKDKISRLKAESIKANDGDKTYREIIENYFGIKLEK